LCCRDLGLGFRRDAPIFATCSFGVASWFTPSIVPSVPETVYIVEDDYGPVGRSFRETDATKADRETTRQDLYSGQFNDPVRVIAFNTREGWSRDVSHELAVELQRRADI
jgi:hypothetical protein